MKPHLLLACCLLACCALLACSKGTTGPKDSPLEPPQVAAGEPVRVETQLGPVKATVTVTPKQPLIGDIMALTLVVEAQDGVQVEMPVFQEAFSRFSIEGYANDREAIKGGERHTQSYRMQAATSGRLRIPPLRVVFFDKRSGAETGAEEQELLTDEISIRVTPVLAGDQATDAELKPIRRALEEYLGPSLWEQYWWAPALGVPLVLLGVGLLLMRRSRKLVQVSPYERASVALAKLEAAGLPEGEALDAWYVALSGIVRRYLEDRFALRAPELTTEEFLRVAQRSIQLSTGHKELLIDFLADCDRVKFAGYEPEAEESKGVLEAARRFLLETRERAEPHGAAQGAEVAGTDQSPAADEEEAA